MGVYIKGIDLPKCNPTWVVIHRGGIIEVNDGNGWIATKGGAIEVKTPHGRLIDADYVSNSFSAKLMPTVRCVAEEAPTIIEAEGKDDA